MTTPWLVSDLQRDEGCRLIAYADPLTRGAPWTIGYGHTGREVHPGLIWTREQAKDALVTDVDLVLRALDGALGWWRSLCDERQDVMANMAFNLGVHGLMDFRRMLMLAHTGDFTGAAGAMLDSEWAEELPERAERLAVQMRTGRRASQDPPP